MKIHKQVTDYGKHTGGRTDEGNMINVKRNLALHHQEVLQYLIFTQYYHLLCVSTGLSNLVARGCTSAGQGPLFTSSAANSPGTTWVGGSLTLPHQARWLATPTTAQDSTGGQASSPPHCCTAHRQSPRPPVPPVLQAPQALQAALPHPTSWDRDR